MWRGALRKANGIEVFGSLFPHVAHEIAIETARREKSRSAGVTSQLSHSSTYSA
jgi:hypothetical protein